MKNKIKNIGLFLLLTASIPTLLTFLFSANKIYIREKMKAKLEKENLVSIEINTAELHWIKKNKEILFEGRLFDIKNIQLEGETYLITGLFDDDETELVKNFEHNQKKGNSTKGLNSIYFHLMQLIQSVYLESMNSNSLIAHDKIQYYNSSFFDLPKLYKDVLTPPPQFTWL